METLNKSIQILVTAALFFYFFSCGKKDYTTADSAFPPYSGIFQDSAGNKKSQSGLNSQITPLMVAASTGSIQSVKQLIKKTKSINAHDSHGRTALFYAVLGDSVPAAEALLKTGADPDFRSFDSLTPLMYAAALGNLSMVKLLVKHGARISTRGRWNQINALWWADRHEHRHITEFLKKNTKKSHLQNQ